MPYGLVNDRCPFPTLTSVRCNKVETPPDAIAHSGQRGLAGPVLCSTLTHST